MVHHHGVGDGRLTYEQPAGRAQDPADIDEFMRRAGLDPDRFGGPDAIERRGGVPEKWEWHTPREGLDLRVWPSRIG
jgi:hypothetical protein